MSPIEAPPLAVCTYCTGNPEIAVLGLCADCFEMFVYRARARGIRLDVARSATGLDIVLHTPWIDGEDGYWRGDHWGGIDAWLDFIPEDSATSHPDGDTLYAEWLDAHK